MKILYIKILLFICLISNAQGYKIGLKFNKTRTMYWENGISARISLKNFKLRNFYIGFDYTSSRFGTALKSNALKQDNYVLHASWYFFPRKSYHIITTLNAGYFYVDLEEAIFKELPHSTHYISPEIGISYEFKHFPIEPCLSSGYRKDFKDEGKSPGTFQPLYYSFSVFYKFKI